MPCLNPKEGLTSQKRIQQIELKRRRIKARVQQLGPMRPGSLTRQYMNPARNVGAYWQISYTRRMRSRTACVRQEWVAANRQQIATDQRFKRRIDPWIDLRIEHSQLTLRMAALRRFGRGELGTINALE
jgi:hypothetical protein